MGRGIAQVCALAGCVVQIFDANDGVVAVALAAVRDDLMTSVARGKLSQSDANAALQRITAAREIGELAECDLVVEAIIERLDAKQQLLRMLEAVVTPGCLLATNTSSLSVTAIASACEDPRRVVGWHFFNPVPRMKVVEVVQAPRTDPAVVKALVDLSERVGHRPIVTFDSPGFVVNHAGRAFVTEGLKLLAERTAEHPVLDAILRTVAGFRMGPFELLDLTGLDVSVPVMESIHKQYYGDDRYRPVALARTRLVAGLLGRKTGQGFYTYGGTGGQPAPAAPATEEALAGARLPALWWPSQGAAAVPDAIGSLLSGCPRVEAPNDADVILLAPLGRDLSTSAADWLLDPAKVVGVDPLFSGPAGVTLMACPGTAPGAIKAAHALFAAQSIPVFEIADSPGFVAPRVVACIVNLACEIAQQGIAKPQDIDAAVRTGLGYPLGPFEWGDRLGPQRMLAILDGLHETFRDPRYRPSPWLVRRARLALSLSAPDRAP
ncbi:3-hydroxyacyl-CoA dehydrogenase [Burkholderia multivorans]|uniref:3-hydroxyacyl-CoA dehydrogenase n=1 Tax=Burkholderia multivorans TaxID=87883 RepID=UPI00201A1406|nr:3-hydroxyacyl-CoA dehydrogenase [Burkholderia multivorans]MCO1367008.1 3-hydroxyacyl-CoA dehydrogenase [Burkholderia multivorans]MCO1376617.1 3-hydroxyacyl-CoA dehydrogenase [Burkholderia multivorans]UQP21338.1 3-hydroxyacyl-CoA dehydrogenase [Burkholderia multivorans]UQP89304.1 3-hydroxyacyl-CoA dehydrogenase [Burkholderia multivorans]